MAVYAPADDDSVLYPEVPKQVLPHGRDGRYPQDLRAEEHGPLGHDGGDCEENRDDDHHHHDFQSRPTSLAVLVRTVRCRVGHHACIQKHLKLNYGFSIISPHINFTPTFISPHI